MRVTSPPSPSNVRLNPGDTLRLKCEAVGVPVPLITWRLNWGEVPPQCTSTSVNGIGTLTCPDMQVIAGFLSYCLIILVILLKVN